MSDKILFVLVSVISTATLLLELLQTRILSVTLWYHFVYITITMALLGFAASGSLLACSKRLALWSHRKFYLVAFSGFSLTSWFVTRFGSYPMKDVFGVPPNTQIVISMVVSYTLFMLPYIFAGLVISGSFMRFPKKISVLYFSNLLGSGLGCILFVLFIGPLGAPKMVHLVSLITILMTGIILVRKKHLVWTLPWVLFLAICLILPQNADFMKIVPEKHKQYWAWFGGNTVHEYTTWNPISRVDVIAHARDLGKKHVLMDGDAQAHLYGRKRIENYITRAIVDREAVYDLLGRKPSRTLVIGAGGGFDVTQADLRGSQHIDAVEINPSTAFIASELYADQVDHIFSKPHISLHVEDGRSFVQRTQSNYDAIILMATDSLLALSTGAYILLDNFLYTIEGFREYIDHLTPDGMIQIGRWYYRNKPRESLRVFATALEALREQGAEDPLSNVLIFSLKRNGGWANTLIKRTPFTSEELARFHEYCKRTNSDVVFSKELLKDYVNGRDTSPFLEMAWNFSNGTAEDFYESYFFNVKPVTDDQPFFYQHQKPRSDLNQPFFNKYYDKIRGIWSNFILSTLFLHCVLLSILLIILPLFIGLKPRKRTFVKMPYMTIYFGSIGLAFMFAEMTVVQKVVLFLGSPIYSMAIVIPTILIFAGLGSLVSGKFFRSSGKNVLILTLISAGFILMLNYLIPMVSGRLLSQPLFSRIISVMLLIAPMAFCMGFPFPMAMKSVVSKSSTLIPWVWAINGSFSVMASIFAILLAQQFGFSFVMLSAAALYVIAGLSAKQFLPAG